MRRLTILFLMAMVVTLQAVAQKTCVIASAEDHVPIREALIHTDNNHWARTDYRGYFTIKYQFDSATVSKSGYMRTTIYLKNLPDTVFLLPDAKQIGEVTVWGKNQEHIDEMEKNIQKEINSTPRAVTGISFNAFGWMDKQGRRDRKHLKDAQSLLKEYDKKDPIVSAYEKATGKKYLLAAPAASQDSIQSKGKSAPAQSLPEGKQDKKSKDAHPQKEQTPSSGENTSQADKQKLHVTVESSVGVTL